MNERCETCGHSPASHEDWGRGHCDARLDIWSVEPCTCKEYVQPSPWSPEIGREIRADGWIPRKTYPCGCDPERLCADHARQRAVEHYHPESSR